MFTIFPKTMIPDMEPENDTTDENAPTTMTLSNVMYKHKSRPLLMKTYYVPTNAYNILYYDKGFVCNDDKVSPFYRSVVVDKNTQKVFCYSVPKSVPLSKFTDSIDQKIDHDKILVNEIVEGTMINLWFDDVANMWQISTKHAVGGKYTFFRKTLEDDSAVSNPEKESGFLGQYNFRTMFLKAFCPTNECPDYQNLENMHTSYLHHVVESEQFSNFFDRKNVYSFVLQHPGNHLVLKIDKPALYLTHIIRIYESDQGGTNAEVTFMKTRPANLPEHIKIPTVYSAVEYSTYQDIIKKMEDQADPATWDTVGIMFTDISTGSRSKILSVNYLRKKNIRGNNPNLLFQYLCLLRVHKITEFLKYFPWYREMFNRFRKQYVSIMMNVHKSYVARYIKRTGEVIAKQYMPHVWRLHHNVFLPSMSTGKKRIVTLDVVHEYFKNLNPMEIFYVMSYKGDKQEPPSMSSAPPEPDMPPQGLSTESVSVVL